MPILGLETLGLPAASSSCTALAALPGRAHCCRIWALACEWSTLLQLVLVIVPLKCYGHRTWLVRASVIVCTQPQSQFSIFQLFLFFTGGRTRITYPPLLNLRLVVQTQHTQTQMHPAVVFAANVVRTGLRDALMRRRLWKSLTTMILQQQSDLDLATVFFILGMHSGQSSATKYRSSEMPV